MEQETISFSNCRVPYMDDSYGYGDLGPALYGQRIDDYRTFWSSLDKGKVPTDLLKRYNIRYVILANPSIVKEQVTGSPEVTLVPVYSNSGYTVDKVVWNNSTVGESPEEPLLSTRGSAT